MHLNDIINAASKINKAVLVYDDDCIFCNKAIKFLFKIDKLDDFRILGFSKTDLKKDSLVLVYRNLPYFKSTAVAKALIILGGKWKLLAYFLLLIPKSCRDYFYDYISSNRQNWLQKSKCNLDRRQILAKTL